MRLVSSLLILFSALAAIAFASEGTAHRQIRIVGSSTVYPFAASVAEHFGKAGDFRTPVVEATGTGAGIKLFCEGAADASPDITNASRAMLASERGHCTKAGVADPIEVKVGFDGITLANSAKALRFHLTRRQIFLALARDLPDSSGALAPNPYMRWREIDPALPDFPIKVFGTPPVSGTRDTFVELIMQVGCAGDAAFAKAVPDDAARKAQCGMLREDGAFIEAGENGNLIAQKLLADPETLGIFGFSFLDQNPGRIQGSLIDGIAPSFDTIQNGSYPVSRPLFFYVKGEHLGLAGMREYVSEFLSEAAIGDEGYLVSQGLVPLPESERAKIREAVTRELKRRG